jgi:hypothetical protein
VVGQARAVLADLAQPRGETPVRPRRRLSRASRSTSAVRTARVSPSPVSADQVLLADQGRDPAVLRAGG